MPRSASQRPTCTASAAAALRKRWSTVSAVSAPPRTSAQSRASKTRAMLSAPPDTATARRGRASNGSKRAISAANSAAPTGVGTLMSGGETACKVDLASGASSGRTPRGSAAEALLLVAGAGLHLRRRTWKIPVEASEGAAGVGLPPELAQRQAELHQIVGRF